MASGMTWCSDFCLACDRQTNGDAYCSQACRLAELDRSSASEPSSPTQGPTAWPSRRLNLPTAYNLPNRKPASIASDLSFRNPFSSTKSISMPTPSTTMSTSQRPLVTSSSQTSLSSLHSNASQTTLSDRARTELRDYANCFDQTRDWKRRANSAS